MASNIRRCCRLRPPLDPGPCRISNKALTCPPRWYRFLYASWRPRRMLFLAAQVQQAGQLKNFEQALSASDPAQSGGAYDQLRALDPAFRAPQLAPERAGTCGCAGTERTAHDLLVPGRRRVLARATRNEGESFPLLRSCILQGSGGGTRGRRGAYGPGGPCLVLPRPRASQRIPTAPPISRTTWLKPSSNLPTPEAASQSARTAECARPGGTRTGKPNVGAKLFRSGDPAGAGVDTCLATTRHYPSSKWGTTMPLWKDMMRRSGWLRGMDTCATIAPCCCNAYNRKSEAKKGYADALHSFGLPDPRPGRLAAGPLGTGCGAGAADAADAARL